MSVLYIMRWEKKPGAPWWQRWFGFPYELKTLGTVQMEDAE